MKRFACLLLLLLYLSFVPTHAQSTSATISGGVTDSTGRFITDADVNIANDATGALYSVKTNSSGFYFVPILPPGTYHVQISKPGFKTIIKPEVVLNVQSAIALNFVLPVGAMSESVTVNADSSLLNTTDASVSTVVDRKFVQNLPLNGRSFQDLISMTPGVVTLSSQQGASIGYQGDFSVNGQRTESNSYSVDGVSGNINAGFPNGYPQAATGGTIAAGTALGTTQSLISVDALQEFRISSSSYSAEFGRFPGGQISLSTRSGTNSFHGTAFDYLRNDYFDANDWFNDRNGVKKTAVRQNDFGGTIGGPIILPFLYHGRDRSFFFASYEGLRLVVPTAATIQYVPSQAVRSEAASNLLPIFNAFPMPTGNEIQVACTSAAADCPSGSPAGTLVASGLAPFVQNYSLPAGIDSTSIRLDHKLFSKSNLFFRVGYTPTSSNTRLLSAESKYELSATTYTAGLTNQFTNSLSNELRFGYASSVSANRTSLDTFGGAQPTNLTAAFAIPSSSNNIQAIPYLSVTSVGTSFIYQFVVNNHLSQQNLTDTFEISAGNHSLKLGIDFRHFTSPLNPAAVTSYAYFYTRQEMLTNTTNNLQVTKRVGATPVFNQLSAFVQDEWKLRQGLTISAGIRWDLAPAPKEANGNDAYTLLGDVANPASLTLAPRGTPLWNTARYNFAPRLGVAWVAHSSPGWETVFRSGGGVFYDTGTQVATLGYTGIGFQTSKSYSGASLPITASEFDFSTTPVAPYTSNNAYIFPTHLQAPYTLEWNTAIQQSLGRPQALTISYVGSSGRRLLQTRLLSVNQFNPNFSVVEYLPGGVTSNYQALQLSLQRTIAKGLQGLASYTWAHSLDFGSTAASYPLSRGNSDFDVRSNFQAGISWDLPTIANRHVLQTLLNGWGMDDRINVRTAFPIPLTGNALYDPTGNRYYSGVNYDSSKSPYLYGPQYPGGRALNGGANNIATPAFTLPLGSASGTAPRNFARAFGAFQVNSAIRRQFQLRDSVALQFRAEAFNVFNHPVFGYVDPTLTDAQFGQVTKTLAQTLGSTSALYQQGGPRSMQFALKVLF